MRDAQRGAGSTVLVEAGAGAGKSRLVQYVRARAAQAQMRVLSARASELELDFPYAIVHQLFDPVVPPSAELPLGETPFSALQGLHSLCLSLSEGAPLLLTV